MFIYHYTHTCTYAKRMINKHSGSYNHKFRGEWIVYSEKNRSIFLVSMDACLLTIHLPIYRIQFCDVHHHHNLMHSCPRLKFFVVGLALSGDVFAVLRLKSKNNLFENPLQTYVHKSSQRISAKHRINSVRTRLQSIKKDH